MEPAPTCEASGVRQHKATGIIHKDPQCFIAEGWFTPLQNIVFWDLVRKNILERHVPLSTGQNNRV